MLDSRIRLEYFDQNERFREILPAEGRITRRLRLGGWKGDWYVLELDQPIEYENRRHRRALIRSRWQGREIGEPGGVSVFVLLPRDEDALIDAEPPHTSFEHVVWGTAIPIPAV